MKGIKNLPILEEFQAGSGSGSGSATLVGTTKKHHIKSVCPNFRVASTLPNDPDFLMDWVYLVVKKKKKKTLTGNFVKPSII